MLEGVQQTLKYVREFAGSRIVVKLGGSVLQDDQLLEDLCQDLSLIRKVGVELVIVHGGGPAINEELKRRDISWKFVEGLRVTSSEMMKVIEMVLCGTVNQRITRALNAAGLRAVGLSGNDASMILCKAADARLGQVGQIERVNTQLIDLVLAMKDDLGHRSIPVIAPIGIGREGEAYNVNADWVASRVASALGSSKVIFLTDQDGILDSTGKLMNELDASDLQQLIEDGTVKDGMLAKVNTILHALQNQVTTVHVLNAKRPHSLLEELFTDKGVGTICRLRSRG